MKLIRFVPFIRRLFGYRKAVINITFKSGKKQRFVLVGNKKDFEVIDSVLIVLKNMIQEDKNGHMTLKGHTTLIARVGDIDCVTARRTVY